MRAQYDIGRLIEKHLPSIWASTQFTNHQKRTLDAIAQCRTSALGGHVLVCTDCGSVQIAYNSCRNRNCPKCQSAQREAWIKKRKEELLPITYFHVVFTLPQALNELCLKHPKTMYNILFKAAWQTINKLGKDSRWCGAQLGMSAILHTWGSNLSVHPHLHCIVTGGGLTKEGAWKNTRSNGKYLFNTHVMGSIFRAKFVTLLRKAKLTEDKGLFKKLFEKEWITYAKRPFLGPEQVIEYIGRYSHKIAITNHRITKIEGGKVSFRYKDYRKKGKQKIMTLDEWEFIRRFARHIVPPKFRRIRHYGLLANCQKKKRLKAAGNALAFQPLKPKNKLQPPKKLNHITCYCPTCETITEQLIIDVLPPIRAGPNKANVLNKLETYKEQST